MKIKRKLRPDHPGIEHIHMFLFCDRNKTFLVVNRLCCNPE